MWTWVKIPKGIALAAFFLPWVTISCGSQKIASGSGWSLMTGNLDTSLPAAQNNGSFSIFMLVAFAAMVVGFLLSLRNGKSAARGVIATSVIALGGIWVRTNGLSNTELARAAAKKSGEGNFDASMAALIRVEWQMGYWVTVLALVAACVLAWMSLTGRTLPSQKVDPQS